MPGTDSDFIEQAGYDGFKWRPLRVLEQRYGDLTTLASMVMQKLKVRDWLRQDQLGMASEWVKRLVSTEPVDARQEHNPLMLARVRLAQERWQEAHGLLVAAAPTHLPQANRLLAAKRLDGGGLYFCCG